MTEAQIIAPRAPGRGEDREGDEFDTTSLRAGGHGYHVHRDYAAHFFRWGWATKWFYRKDASVLDVGCGPDLALPRSGAYRNRMPGTYVGVDLNKLEWPWKQPAWATLYGETDFTDIEVQRTLWKNHGPFDAVICFEVIEHMTVERGDELLAGIRRLMKDDGYALLSTPVFNGSRAANHIHEYGIGELKRKIEDAGLLVDKRYGTFASHADVVRGIRDWYLKHGNRGLAQFEMLYEELREFHSDDVLSTFLAPAIPDYSRNNAWRLIKQALA